MLISVSASLRRGWTRDGSICIIERAHGLCLVVMVKARDKRGMQNRECESERIGYEMLRGGSRERKPGAGQSICQRMQGEMMAVRSKDGELRDSTSYK